MRKLAWVGSLVLLMSCVSVLGQAEAGKFTLHKFMQPIGEERYSITKDGDRLVLEADFAFTDRGMQVPLKAWLRAGQNWTPQSFTIKGKTSRYSEIDAEVTIEGANARVRDGKDSKEVKPGRQYFTVAGYSPVSLEMAMMRYWRGHGSPARLATLPAGEVEIKDRGAETVTVGGQEKELRRYSLKGLVWGLETLWMDKDNNLVALVTRDAEFDHFEALREGYESALSSFVSSAAKDEMEELAELSRVLPGRKSGTLAFVGGTLIDGTGKAPLEHATIVTQNGKIVAAGASRTVKIPAGATQVDLKGKFVVPGLWDMHAHYEQVEWGPIYLAGGITTVRDVGNEFEFITTVRDQINSGRGLGPHMLLAGIVDGSGKYPVGVTRVDSAEDAARWVKKYHDAGFQQMKLYSSVTRENVQAVCKEAHAVGMTVTGHIPNGMDVFDGVNAGMDQVNHMQYLVAALVPKDFDRTKASQSEWLKAVAKIDVKSEAAQGLVKFLKDHGTVIDDTVGSYEMLLRGADEPATTIEPGVAKVAPELKEQLMNGGLPPEMAVYGKQAVARLLEIIGALHKSGVTVVAGTDQNVPAYSVYREIELYVKAGFTPMEALQAATIVPARVMKEEKDSGTVEAGKRADFAILERDPLKDISNIRSVKSVVSNGVLYETAPLWKTAGFTP